MLRSYSTMRPPAACGAKRDLRGTATERGYTSRWARVAAEYRRQHPYCVMCDKQGIVSPAECVDHVVPHQGNDKLFWDESNWQSLCWACHNNKTANERRRANR